MALVRILVAALALAGAVPARAEKVSDWQPYIAEASGRFGVPSAWIERVMHAESKGRTTLDGRPIRSPAGAIGLMQLMPGTWADMRQRLGLGDDPDNPRDNILAGTLYLRLMFERSAYPGLFAAYNAGPARYAAHLASGRQLPSETVAYIQAVGGRELGRDREPGKPAPVTPPDALFAVRNVVPMSPGEAATQRPRASLFVELGNGR